MDITYYKKYEPIFGSWHIVREIGEGSFGKVFEIEREDFGRVYKSALKAITIPQNQSEIKSAMADGFDKDSVTSYFRGFGEEMVYEFALMSQLKGHSNIVSYEDHRVIEHDECIGWNIFIRMELLTPLVDYVQEHTLTPSETVKLGIDMCKALEACRTCNIIHRDIKPENIFVSKLGDYKLGDFGIAKTVEKTTGGLSKKGTYTYMAPEVYKGEKYGPSVDIYSLGIVLYRYLNNNRTPFLLIDSVPTYKEKEEALYRRINGEALPAPVNADSELAAIILKACAYNPKDRYASPAEMREALEAAAKAAVSPAAVSPMVEQPVFEEYDDKTVWLFGAVNPPVVTEIPSEAVTVKEIPVSEAVTVKEVCAEDAENKTEGIFGVPPKTYETEDTLTSAADDIEYETSEETVTENLPANAPSEENEFASTPELPAQNEPPAKTDRKSFKGKSKKVAFAVLIAMAAALLILLLCRNNSAWKDAESDMETPTATEALTDNSKGSTPTSTPTSTPKPQKWSEWSEWSANKVTPSDTGEVETRTVYVYNLYRYNLQYGYCIKGNIDASMIQGLIEYLEREQDVSSYTDEEIEAMNRAKIQPMIDYIVYDKNYENMVSKLAQNGISLAYETTTVKVSQPLELTKSGSYFSTTANGEKWFSESGTYSGTETQYRSRTKS